MPEKRTRSTPEQAEELRKRVQERLKSEKRKEEEVRITAMLEAERKKKQDEMNTLNAPERADKDSDNKVYEEGSLDTEDAFSEYNGEPRQRLRRGQRKREADEKERDNSSNDRQYRSMFPSSVETNIASTISLAEMRELLNGPRAPALLLSDEDEEDGARRSGIYDPPPPPRACRGRASALWETFPESWLGSGDRR